MKPNSSLFFLPPNLRDVSKTPIFPGIAGVYDKALELTYFNEINKLKNLYNPNSDYYDTDYILNLLGENTLQNLLSDVTDKISLTMIVSDIQNIKGTKKAFYAILSLLKITYKTLVFKTLDNGCTEVTIVFDQGQRINIADIALLDKYAQEVFPLCLSLTGVTNCATYEVSGIYNGFNTVDLGMHYLDRTFILDMSKLDQSYGLINKNISSTIAMLICNSTKTESDLDGQLIDSLTGHLTTSNLYYGRTAGILLDVNLILDRFNPVDYYGFITTLGKVSSADLVYGSDILAVDNVVLKPKYAFILDQTLMDIAPFEPLDGLNNIITISKGLDTGLILDSGTLDTKTTVITKITNPQLRKTLTDVSSPAISPTIDAPITHTYHCLLDYHHTSASMYLPMLNI